MRRAGAGAGRGRSRAAGRGCCKTAFPIGVAFLLFVLLMRLDVTLLSFIAGEEEVGLYAAAYRLVESTQFVAWAMSAAMMPWLSRTAAGGLTRGYELGLLAMNGVLLPISLVLRAVRERADRPPVRERVRARGAAAAAARGSTSALYGMQSFASHDADRARLAEDVREAGRASSSCSTSAANLIVIPKYGADGAAAVSLASGVVLGVVSVWLAGRRVGGVRPWRSLAGAAGGLRARWRLSALLVPRPAGPGRGAGAGRLPGRAAGRSSGCSSATTSTSSSRLVPSRLSAWSASRSRNGRRSA